MNIKMKIFIFPPNSLILADLVERFGHKPLALQNKIEKLVRNPEIDAPPLNITDEILNRGLKYVTVETPAGIRGRLGVMNPLIEEAEAAIIVNNAKYSFGCVGCYESGQYIIYLIKRKKIPILEIEYPTDENQAKEMIKKIRDFLSGLT
ncbi:MAG: methanogenesis marker 5 protein [Candidatus Lokiarchaeota archaeon]|nr:methanogenesis marker 5 protein [Candidatus Lokiarchaeota archaeon]